MESSLPKIGQRDDERIYVVLVVSLQAVVTTIIHDMKLLLSVTAALRRVRHASGPATEPTIDCYGPLCPSNVLTTTLGSDAPSIP